MTEKEWVLFEADAIRQENRGDFASATDKAIIAAYRELKERRDAEKYLSEHISEIDKIVPALMHPGDCRFFVIYKPDAILAAKEGK